MEISDALSIVLGNNKILISTLVQFAMGIAVGYYFAKAVKYLLALVLVLVVGALLNVWSIGGSLDSILSTYFTQFKEHKEEVLSLIKFFGAVLVGPVLVGFIVGVIIGLTRK